MIYFIIVGEIQRSVVVISYRMGFLQLILARFFFSGLPSQSQEVELHCLRKTQNFQLLNNFAPTIKCQVFFLSALLLRVPAQNPWCAVLWSVGSGSSSRIATWRQAGCRLWRDSLKASTLTRSLSCTQRKISFWGDCFFSLVFQCWRCGMPYTREQLFVRIITPLISSPPWESCYALPTRAPITRFVARVSTFRGRSFARIPFPLPYLSARIA